MPDDIALTTLLTQLDSIAKAPMTVPERELRAKPLFAADLTPAEVARATARADLPWVAQKAQEHGVSVETWVQAAHVVDLPSSQSVAELLDRLHRAEAAAGMLKAGYTADKASGSIVWSAGSG